MVEYIGKKIRTEKRITVRGLAKMAGIAPSTISKWEQHFHLLIVLGCQSYESATI